MRVSVMATKGLWRVVLVVFVCLLPVVAAAHCDTVDGPVVLDGQRALREGDVAPALKWVTPAHEEEIKALFGTVATVRQAGGDGGKLAEQYFLENLVRLHRAGEGAPYNGLQPAGTVDHAVAMADTALANKSIDELVDILSRVMAAGIRERFSHALAAGEKADESVDAGRLYVAAYVDFMHHVENLHLAVQGGGGHHGEAAAAPAPAGCPKHRQ
ncbi:MAG: DUF6448 family protein [Desulfobulbaceae bacterium]|nr:DUF6448 family protein [Desulfobulbaceae bacterium]